MSQLPVCLYCLCCQSYQGADNQLPALSGERDSPAVKRDLLHTGHTADWVSLYCNC